MLANFVQSEFVPLNTAKSEWLLRAMVTTDRLPNAGWIVVTQADRAPVGLKADAVLPAQPDLYAQIAEGRFLQPGPLLSAATAWAHAILHHEVRP